MLARRVPLRYSAFHPVTARAYRLGARARWPLLPLIGIVLSAAGPARTAQAQDVRAVTDALRQRQHVLDKLYAEFTWVGAQAPLTEDPFDWKWFDAEPHEVNYDCGIWLLRPHFRWRIVASQPWQGEETRTWIDAKTTTIAQNERGVWSVVVDSDRRVLTGPFPLLTPFEMQTFDIERSFLEIIEADTDVRVEGTTSGHVVVSAHHSRPSVWTISAEYDPARGWLPLETCAKVAYESDGAKRKIQWTVRTVRSVPVNGVHAIQEAIFALNNGRHPRWQLYHFLASRITPVSSLNKADLAIEVPRSNLRLLDKTTGHDLVTDSTGATVEEHWWTAEEIERARRSNAEAVAASARARELLAHRRRVAYAIGFSALGIVIVVAGAWAWRRRRLRLL